MTRHDNEYGAVLQDILSNGYKTENRTGVDTITTFGQKMTFDLNEAFPLMTGKEVHWRSVVEELLWFMRGETNVKSLQEKGITIWDEWADENGELGPIYGSQWRRWEHIDKPKHTAQYYCPRSIDQLAIALHKIRHEPRDRRIIVSAWNVGTIDQMKLPPCHILYQFHVRPGPDGFPDQFLDGQMYQRSCDFFLGVPFNVASYSLLIHILAHMAGLRAGTFTWIGGDCHIYENHLQQVATYLQREPPKSPKLIVEPGCVRTLDDWQFDDFTLVDYNPLPKIPAPVAV